MNGMKRRFMRSITGAWEPRARGHAEQSLLDCNLERGTIGFVMHFLLCKLNLPSVNRIAEAFACLRGG